MKRIAGLLILFVTLTAGGGGANGISCGPRRKR
jgi:hypothetical protein